MMAGCRSRRRGWLRLGELALAGWSVVGVAWALSLGGWVSAGWLGFQALGFLAVQRS